MKAVILLRLRNSKRRDIAYIGQEFELIDWDVRYGYDENNRDTYNVFQCNRKVSRYIKRM